MKNNGKKVHSTQKPESLLYRIILSSSNVGDLVLDPFMGTGTTAAVAKKLRRKYIGFEIDDYYISEAEKRIAKVLPLPEDLLDYKIEKKPPKVSFGMLIENKYIEPGNILYSRDLKHKAIVKANASIEYKGKVGSIHSISAFILGKKANNGWEFWYLKNSLGELVSIDSLRKKFAINEWSEEWNIV